MKNNYKILNNNVYLRGNYSIVPIRYKDRIDIMKWRNDQMYHLRQNAILTEKDQDHYFDKVVSKLFEVEYPSQMLFSFLKNDSLIGYGGLVHINWEAKNAEVSFIMDTSLEKLEFELNWSNFLKLIKKIAFQELRFNSIFTYAYDLRPHLFLILKKNQFILKNRLEKEVNIDGKMTDVLIHECINESVQLGVRPAEEKDKLMIYDWSNDDLVRSQSFNSNIITVDEHCKWFIKKMKDKNSLLLINEIYKEPIGLVRFDIKKTHSIIGIMLANKFRGKGLSSKMLINSISFYLNLFSKPIFAYIKEDNVPSIKAFEKAGFEFTKNESVIGVPAGLYKYEKHR